MRGHPVRVRAIRGEETESVHRVHGVVVGLRDGEEVQFGDPGLLAYWRSSFKPFQALPLVEDGAAESSGYGPAELALACGSHRGTPSHVALAAAMLERLGLSEAALACGPHPPTDEESAAALRREGRAPGRLHNNCSGKHAGMLCVARHRGWRTEGYDAFDHPVQARIRQALRPWLDLDPATVRWAVDGCGVPTPYLSLRQMARAYARLARASAAAPRAVVGAMTSQPDLVSGVGGLATEVMRATGGRVLAKEGAEGVFCAAGVEAGWGCALKVADGGRRAVGPALVAMLAGLELLDAGAREALAGAARPPLLNTQGRTVGRLDAEAHPRAVPVAGRL